MIQYEPSFALGAAGSRMRAPSSRVSSIFLLPLLFMGAVSCRGPRDAGAQHSQNALLTGRIELVGSLAGDPTCPSDNSENQATDESDEPHAFGKLRFDSVSGAQSVSVVADTPAPTSLAHYEIAPGSYAVNWEPVVKAGEDTPPRWMRVIDPAVINVFAGRVTRLEVERYDSGCDVLSLHSPSEAETEIVAAVRP